MTEDRLRFDDPDHAPVICGECPEIYSDTRIDAEHGDVKTKLYDLRQSGRQAKPRRRSGILRQWFAPEPLPPVDAPATSRPVKFDLERFKDWTFTCPKQHVVDGNPDSQFPVAVLGLSGSSKSHFIAGVVQELGRQRRLRDLRISLGDPRYRQPALRADVDRVYVEGRQLDQTPPDQLRGPFAQRLRIGDPDDPAFHSLVMFDIAGERLSSIMDIAEKAGFVLLAEGVVVLIDPKDCFHTQFDGTAGRTERQRQTAAVYIRDSINVIAATLTEAMGLRNPRQLTIPICFVVSKADAVDWTDAFDWQRQTADVIDEVRSGEDLTVALEGASARVRATLKQNGGELLVDEIEDLFNPAYVRYAAASATCCMPAGDAGSGGWDGEPDALGVALAMLHIFDAAGLVRSRQSAAPVTGRFELLDRAPAAVAHTPLPTE